MALQEDAGRTSVLRLPLFGGLLVLVFQGEALEGLAAILAFEEGFGLLVRREALGDDGLAVGDLAVDVLAVPNMSRSVRREDQTMTPDRPEMRNPSLPGPIAKDTEGEPATPADPELLVEILPLDGGLADQTGTEM